MHNPHLQSRFTYLAGLMSRNSMIVSAATFIQVNPSHIVAHRSRDDPRTLQVLDAPRGVHQTHDRQPGAWRSRGRGGHVCCGPGEVLEGQARSRGRGLRALTYDPEPVVVGLYDMQRRTLKLSVVCIPDGMRSQCRWRCPHSQRYLHEENRDIKVLRRLDHKAGRE